MILITGCAAPKKVSEASGDAKKTVDIDTSGDAVKVGILHSLSGTMAISEVSVHDAVWNYFQTTNTSVNQTFVKNYKKMNGGNRVTSDPIEAGYNAVYLWAAAVEKAKSFDVDKVKKAADGITFNAPGGPVKIDGDTQHLYKTVRIGEIMGDGQFKEVWNSGDLVKPDPYVGQRG